VKKILVHYICRPGSKIILLFLSAHTKMILAEWIKQENQFDFIIGTFSIITPAQPQKFNPPAGINKQRDFYRRMLCDLWSSSSWRAGRSTWGVYYSHSRVVFFDFGMARSSNSDSWPNDTFRDENMAALVLSRPKKTRRKGSTPLRPHNDEQQASTAEEDATVWRFLLAAPSSTDHSVLATTLE
jgi:hypothetical protein